MTSKALLGDSTFDSLLQRWLEDQLCPFVLVDYLLDNGLEHQARFANLIVSAGRSKATEWLLSYGPKSGFRPAKTITTPALWYWSERSRVSFRYNGGAYWELPRTLWREVRKHANRVRAGYHRYFLSAPDAICGLLEGGARVVDKLKSL